jgi:GWxTD domain-containing protein
MNIPRIDNSVTPFHNENMPRAQHFIIVITLLAATLFTACAPLSRPSMHPDQADSYVEWLLMTNPEQSLFKGLKTREEREGFIETFWQARNPHPGSADNLLREEISERIDFCNQWFREAPQTRPGWDTDRGRIYVVLGPPDSRERQDAPYGTGSGFMQNRSYERWVYGQHDLTLYFSGSQTFGGFRLEMPPLRLHRVLETVKTTLLTGLVSDQGPLTLSVSRVSGTIEITIQTSQLYYEEDPQGYITALNIRITPEGGGEPKPVSLTRRETIAPQELLNQTPLVISIAESDLPAHFQNDPLIIEIEDLFSKRKGEARLEISQRLRGESPFPEPCPGRP